MSSSKRERDYARRRYDRWQARRLARTERRRRRLQWASLVAGVLAVVLLVGGVWWLTRDTTPEQDDAAAGQDAAPGQDEGGTAGSCPEPTGEPGEPAQFEQAPDPATAGSGTRTATVRTSCGELTVELFADRAPQAVASFAFLAAEDYFASTRCHRLTTEGISVLQCGDPTGTGQGGPGYTFGPVENAPADDTYPAGSLAMARVGGDASSMGSQFFVVYEESTIPSDAAGGYTVFGRVTDGLDVVQQVADGGVEGGGGDGPPAVPISIEAVSVQ